MTKRFSELKDIEKIPDINITLHRNCKKKTGINNLKDLEWTEYNITDPDNILNGYTRILVTAYAINDAIQKEAAKKVYDTGVAFQNCIRPHVDVKTGNIHPLKLKNNFDFLDKEIQQIVLVKGAMQGGKETTHSGPALKECAEPCYTYTVNSTCKQNVESSKKSKISICVPKSSYYPLIDKNDEELLKNNTSHIILRKIWETLCKK